MKWINRLKNPIKKNHYLKTLLYYSIFVMIILLLSFFLSVTIFKASFEEKIAQSNFSLLKQVQLYTDEKLNANTSALISNNFIEYGAYSPMLSFLSPTEPLNTTIVLEAYDSACYLAQSYEYIDSIYLYRTFDGTSLSTKEGIFYDNTSEYSKTLFSSYQNSISLIKSLEQNSIWLSPAETQTASSAKPIICFGKTVPLRSSFPISDGYVLINLDQKKLFVTINEIYGENGELLIMDTTGKLFAQNKDFLWIDNPENKAKIIEKIHDSEEGFFSVTIDKTTYGVTYLPSQTGSWHYISIIPISQLNQKITEITKIIMLCFFAFLVIALFFTYFITYFLHKPFRQLALEAGRHSNLEKGQKDDLSYMKDVFSFLSTQVGEMEQSVQENEKILEYKALMDLLYSQVSQDSSKEDTLAFLKTRFPFDYYSLFILEINPYFFENLSLEQREFISITIKELTDDFLSKYFKVISIRHPANSIIALVNFNPDSLSLPQASSFLDMLETKIGVKCNISISDKSNHVFSTDTLFLQSKKGLQYSYIYEYKHVFTCEQIQRYESSCPEVLLLQIEQLPQLLAGYETAKIEQLLSSLHFSVLEQGASYDFVQSLCLTITNTVFKFYQAKNIAVSIDDKSQLNNQFIHIASFKDSLDWINSTIKKYNEALQKAESSSSHQFMQQIAGYIEEHVDQNISLQSVSEKFQMSPSHLSRLFKENLSTNFQDFLFDKKLEKATQLLSDQPNKNISEIAFALGYLTPAYFSKIFKEKYGITPSVYRKQELSRTIDNSSDHKEHKS